MAVNNVAVEILRSSHESSIFCGYDQASWTQMASFVLLTKMSLFSCYIKQCFPIHAMEQIFSLKDGMFRALHVEWNISFFTQ